MVDVMRQEHSMSIRAACKAINISRTVYYYRPDTDRSAP